MKARQSTALTLIVGPILDSAGVEYASAVIGDLSLSKNGGTLTALASAATLTVVANGYYTLVLTTGNTDTLGVIQITCNKVTYQMPMKERQIVPAMVFDSIVLGTDVLQADLTQIAGDTQSATDLKDFADAGYDPSTNKVQGVVLVDTLTTYIGNTVQTGDGYSILNSGTFGNSAMKTILDIIATDTTTDIPALIAALSAFVDTEVAAIKAKTDNLPADPADQSSVEAAITAATSPLATASNLATVATYVGIILDSVVVFNGLVQDASPTAAGFDTNLTQADDWWSDKVILFISGNLQYQSRVCSAYVNASGAMTFDEPFTTAPTNGSNFYILSIHAHTISQIQSGLATQSSVNDLPTNAELATAITAGLTTALTEGYRATNATGSVRDLLYEMLQSITEFTISGTTKTVKKIDGSTTAKTYTLNDATTPTGITETT